MFIKKVIVCVSVFTAILVMAGMINVRMEAKRQESLSLLAPLAPYFILSTQPEAMHRQPDRRFQSREYVRVIKRVEN